jgi:hypothetical protein
MGVFGTNPGEFNVGYVGPDSSDPNSPANIRATLAAANAASYARPATVSHDSGGGNSSPTVSYNGMKWAIPKNAPATATLAQASYQPQQAAPVAQPKAPDADPWGTSGGRAQAAGQLASQNQNDPSNLYRDKLAAMSSGKFTPDDPSYQFRFDQGQQAVERSAASKGLLGSGNAAIELQQYGQGAASQEYGAQFNRMLAGMSGVESQFNTQMSRLQTMAGVTNDPLANSKLAVTQGELANQQQSTANQFALGSQSNATQAQSVANNYSLGLGSNAIAQQQANQSGGSGSIYANVLSSYGV